MHEWVNEDQKMMVWTLVLESETVLPEDQAGDRLLRDLRVGAANDTDASIWSGDVRHGS